MRPFPLILFNNLSYCLAVMLILSLLIKRKRTSYLFVFFIITAAGLLLTLTEKSNLTMPATIALLTVCFSLRGEDWRLVFTQCLTAVFLSWCFIMPLSCLIMMIAPSWHDGIGCNLLTGGTLIAYAILLRKVPIERLQQIAASRYAVMLELLVLSFFTLLLPRYFPVFHLDSKRLIGLFTLAFLLFLAVVGLLVHRMERVEFQRRELQEHIRHQEQVEAQYQTAIMIKHYYSRLYQTMAPLIRNGDMERLNSYFETEIAPIQRKQFLYSGKLEQVYNPLTRNLLEITAAQAEAMETVTFELDVEGTVMLAKQLELQAFEILCNLLDNALQELEGQSRGLLQVELWKDESVFVLTVANTIQTQMHMESFCQPERKLHHGHGLRRIREMVYQSSCMEQFTYLDGKFAGKDILIQQIKWG